MYPTGGRRPERPTSTQPRATPWEKAMRSLRPERAKAFLLCKRPLAVRLLVRAFALTGRGLRIAFTQGAALGYELTGLSGRYRVIADNYKNIQRVILYETNMNNMNNELMSYFITIFTPLLIYIPFLVGLPLSLRPSSVYHAQPFSFHAVDRL